MKKKLFLMVSFIFLTIGIAMAESGHNLTSVRDDGDSVIVTIANIRMTPIGKNTEGKDLIVPEVVELYSGIMDANGIKKPFAIANVVNGVATFQITNSAKVAGVPVIEHLWSLSPDKKFALVIDPADPWACYKVNNGTPDLNTLAIGIIMYPDQPTAPLKPYGKLPQGEHPELAGN